MLSKEKELECCYGLAACQQNQSCHVFNKTKFKDQKKLCSKQPVMTKQLNLKSFFVKLEFKSN